MFYPDRLNGTWTFCPDPVDFSYFQMVDIYRDDNAFHMNSAARSGSQLAVLTRPVELR